MFSGINPYYTISLFTEIFGTESIDLDSGIIVTTLSAGELKNDIIIRTVQRDLDIRLNNLCGCSFKF